MYSNTVSCNNVHRGRRWVDSMILRLPGSPLQLEALGFGKRIVLQGQPPRFHEQVLHVPGRRSGIEEAEIVGPHRVSHVHVVRLVVSLGRGIRWRWRRFILDVESRLERLLQLCHVGRRGGRLGLHLPQDGQGLLEAGLRQGGAVTRVFRLVCERQENRGSSEQTCGKCKGSSVSDQTSIKSRRPVRQKSSSKRSNPQFISAHQAPGSPRL